MKQTKSKPIPISIPNNNKSNKTSISTSSDNCFFGKSFKDDCGDFRSYIKKQENQDSTFIVGYPKNNQRNRKLSLRSECNSLDENQTNENKTFSPPIPN